MLGFRLLCLLCALANCPSTAQSATGTLAIDWGGASGLIGAFHGSFAVRDGRALVHLLLPSQLSCRSVRHFLTLVLLASCRPALLDIAAAPCSAELD